MSETESQISEPPIIGFNEGNPINFEEALNIIGFGKYNIYLIIACGICLFSVNTTVYGVGYILPAAECDLNLNTTDKGLLTAVAFIGIICSLYVWGAIADVTGRKRVIIIGLIGAFLCDVLCMFSASFSLFAFFQFMNGVFISGSSSTIYAYLGEFHGNNRRSSAVAWCTVVMNSALALLPLIAWVTLIQTFSFEVFNFTFLPWRLFVLLCGVPCLISAVLMMAFPESPKFLLVQGKSNEALSIIRKIYMINSGKDEDSFPIKPALNSHKSNDDIKQSKVSIFGVIKTLWHQMLPLFKRDYRKYTYVTCTLQFGAFAISSGLLLWYPDILNKLSESAKINPNASLTICEALNFENQTKAEEECDGIVLDYTIFQQNVIIGVAYGVGCFAVGLFIDLIGKRILLVISFLITVLCCISIPLTSGIAIDILFIGILVAPGLSVPIINAAVVDIFPTQFKVMAVSICLLMGRLGSVVASSIVGYLLELTCTGTFYIYAALNLGCLGLSLLIPNKNFSQT